MEISPCSCPGKVKDDALLRGPIGDLPVSFIEGINEQLIMKASLRTKDSGGSSFGVLIVSAPECNYIIDNS